MKNRANCRPRRIRIMVHNGITVIKSHRDYEKVRQDDMIGSLHPVLILFLKPAKLMKRKEVRKRTL